MQSEVKTEVKSKPRPPAYTVGEFSFGNLKLPVSTGIFNMTPYESCPSRLLKICKVWKICYTRKAEQGFYKHVLPFRRRQMAYWKTCTAKDFIAYFLACSMIAERKSKVKVDSLRFSEAGDFPAQCDVDKMATIASALKKKGIATYGYTSRHDLDFSRLMKHATIQGSGFMLSNEFRIVDSPSGNHPVCAGNCRICHLCMTSKNLVIETIKH